jgi:hypothetical protein
MVMIYNRPIVAFRADLFGYPPLERAKATEDRIYKLIEGGRIGKVTTRTTSEGTMFFIGDQALFLISPGDLDPIAGNPWNRSLKEH